MADISYHGPVVAFDLDDTLFRERDFCRSGFQFLCNPDLYRVSGVAPYPSRETLLALSREMDGEISARRNPFVPFERLFRPLVEQGGGAWNLQGHIAAYRSHRPERLSFAADSLSLITALAEAGVRMALITDGRSVTQRRKIEALGLDRFISPNMILISGETGSDKHSRDMFVSVVREFPEASGFFYVGDNPLKDFYHPNLLGWKSVMVPYNPDNVHEQTEPPSPLHAPAVSLKNYLSLLDIINDIINF